MTTMPSLMNWHGLPRPRDVATQACYGDDQGASTKWTGGTFTVRWCSVPPRGDRAGWADTGSAAADGEDQS